MRPNPRPRLRRNRAEDASFQTGTPAFRRWFGDSKVVDAKGRPLVVYHGTTGPRFDAFVPRRTPRKEHLAFGFHFTEDEGLAARYAFDPDVRRKATKGGEPRVIEAWLSIQNPFDATGWVEHDSEGYALLKEIVGKKLRPFFVQDGVYLYRVGAMLDHAPPKRVEQILRTHGYDGVRYTLQLGFGTARGRTITGEGVGWLAFDPRQIKSATENVGAFDPEDTDIRRNPRRRLRRNTLAVQLREGHPSLRRTKAFVQEWHDRDMDRVFADMGARVDVSVGSGDAHDAVSLDSLEALTYRKGAGSRALRALLDLTDKHGLTVTLTAEPFSFGDATDLISRDALVRFYKRFGFDFDESEGSPEWFEDEDEGYYPMVRYPRTSNPRGR
jgi:hypothetical protein